MGIEVWIVLLLAGCAVSGFMGYTVAVRGRPTRDEVKVLEEALAEAREQAETVQANVNEHFEQSAVLFGRLAKDYREFLDHFSDSARSLGLSEGRARELIEQGFQPVLTHEAVADIVPEPEAVKTGTESGPTVQEAEAATAKPADTGPEPPVLDSVVAANDEPTTDETVNVESAEAESMKNEPATGETPEEAGEKKPATAAVADVVVEMPDEVQATEEADEAEAAAEKEDAAEKPAVRKTGG